MNQAARERVIAKLKSKTLRVLVATDVAARGIDISHITHVVNYDLPGDNESYVHRIGRTARAGKEGAAISFVTPSEKRRLQQLQRHLKIEMKEVFAPGNADLRALHRQELWTELEGHIEGSKDVREWCAELLADNDLTAEQLAIAALSMLSRQKEHSIEEVQAPRNRAERRGKPSKEDRERLNEAEIFLNIGRRAGIQISDIVGAIANEAGISGGDIGRISLNDTTSFVGLPKDLAERVVTNHPEILVRGKPTRIEMARGNQGPAKPRKHRGGGRPFNERKPKFKKNAKRKMKRSQRRSGR